MNAIIDRATLLADFLDEHAQHINETTFTSARVGCFDIEVQFSDGIRPILFALDAFPDATITVRSVTNANGDRTSFHILISSSYRGSKTVIVSLADANDPALDWAWFNGEPTRDELVVTAAYLREALNATEAVDRG